MHCPECGFINSEGANYCQKCGAFLGDVAPETDDTTAAWQLDETGDIKPVDPETVTEEGTLVIRAGGGRAGETFQFTGDQMRIGRSPDAEVFPDISISKIRYLEDQKLLAPRRTQGGYRLYSPADLSRLRTILRLQRDEFLPLRVIRQELAAGRAETDVSGAGKGPDPRTLRRTSVAVTGEGALYRLADVLDDTAADPKLVKELED